MIHLNLCEAVLFEFTVIMLIMNFEKNELSFETEIWCCFVLNSICLEHVILLPLLINICAFNQAFRLI